MEFEKLQDSTEPVEYEKIKDVFENNLKCKIENVFDYFEKEQNIEDLSLDSIEEEAGFYKINLDYKGSIIPFYVTKTGYLTGNSISLIIPKKSMRTG
mgnify:CR=1 FL=1